MSYSIQNKTALITGANRGIGKAIVEAFLKYEAAKVYVGVRRLDKASGLVDQYGDKIVPIQIDYNSPASIEAAAKTASDVEVVVSNAGMLNTASPLADNVIESFEQELQVNVYGLLRMAKAFAPVLKANGGGAFVQINSIASLLSFPNFSTYCASKATAYSFTQALRPTFAEQDTALLSVHPGPIATDMAHDAGLDDMTDSVETVSEGIVEALQNGQFHLFPDKMAKDFEKAYLPFAQGVVEAPPAE
jgi:NAD(P)-dependent dehydrogenase (short-subunit alcohol dehydrogenase family)